MSSPRQKLSETLSQRVASGLHLGVIRYGERLPSIRKLAREFSVDPRVVLSAYRDLEKRGIVERRPRSGIYVATPEPTGKAIGEGQRDWLVDLLADGIAQGIPATQFAERVRRSLETLRLRAVVMECNNDQLFSLSSELERDYGIDVTPIDTSVVESRLPAEALSADCVVTTAQHADDAKGVAESIGVPLFVLSMCDDLFAEVRRLLIRGSVYFVVTDERFRSKLRGVFAGETGSENLRVLLADEDDIDSIPHDAPAYLTRLTRQKIDTLPSLDRVIPETSVFSESSSRRILDFVIRSNMSVRWRSVEAYREQT